MEKPLSSTQILTLMAFSKQSRALSYSTMYQRYPRFGFKITTMESLERKGFLKIDRRGETVYRHSYKITLEGKKYLENNFSKSKYYKTLMKTFYIRTEGADV